jgi:hypothetical protein
MILLPGLYVSLFERKTYLVETQATHPSFSLNFLHILCLMQAEEGGIYVFSTYNTLGNLRIVRKTRSWSNKIRQIHK